MITGSDTIDASLPRFQIISRNNHTFENETLQKVGITSGWTYGAVESTCDDVNSEVGAWILCSDRVDYVSDPGDSGSPVFYLIYGDNAELRGIHWGAADGYLNTWNDAWMSDLHQIELDLGSLVVYHMTAAIESGPDFVPQNAWCQWVGNADGGIAPFSYEWRKDGNMVSTSNSYTTSNTGSSDFQLSFRVIDALSDTAMNFLGVTVDTTSTAFSC